MRVHTHTRRISYIHIAMDKYTHSHRQVHIATDKDTQSHTQRGPTAPRNRFYQFYKGSCAGEKELHLNQSVTSRAGAWGFKYTLQHEASQSSTAKLGSDARGPGLLPVLSLQQTAAAFRGPTPNHGPGQRRRFRGKGNKEQRDEPDPQSQGVARCDGSLEETRSSSGRTGAFPH